MFLLGFVLSGTLGRLLYISYCVLLSGPRRLQWDGACDSWCIFDVGTRVLLYGSVCVLRLPYASCVRFSLDLSSVLVEVVKEAYVQKGKPNKSSDRANSFTVPSRIYPCLN